MSIDDLLVAPRSDYFGFKSHGGSLELYLLIELSGFDFMPSIVEMSPDEFISETVRLFSGKESIDNGKVRRFAAMMKNGVKFDMPYLILESYPPRYNGRHRAYAAKKVGIELIPAVLLNYRQSFYSLSS